MSSLEAARQSGGKPAVAERRQNYAQVDRRTGLSVRDFNREYRRRKPVVLTDAIRDWKACSSWTFDFFKSAYGKSPVTVHRYQGAHYQPQDVRRMNVDEFIDGVVGNDWKAFPYYVRDNWAFLVEHPELAADYRLPDYFFDWYALLPSFLRLPYPRIFIGPSGAVTPLHQDHWGTHAWLSQLAGRKRWLLYPPEQRDLLYNFKVDPGKPDLKQFPLYAQATPLECTIGPGDTVFVPSNWIHWVVSLDPTISLSSNYMGPGCLWPALPHTVWELLVKRVWKATGQKIFRPAARTEAAK